MEMLNKMSRTSEMRREVANKDGCYGSSLVCMAVRGVILGCLLVSFFAGQCALGEGRAPTFAASSKLREGGPIPQPYFEMSQQRFSIEFKDARSAQQAKLKILPLYDGKKYAISCRWDDNRGDANVIMARKMHEFGIKGTFYLNGPQGDSDWSGGDGYLETGKICLKEGMALGSHSWSHPAMSVMSTNRKFEELARMRVCLEEMFDITVNDHAWSFCDSGGKYFGEEGERAVAESLFRAGYHCVAQGWGLKTGPCPRQVMIFPRRVVERNGMKFRAFNTHPLTDTFLKAMPPLFERGMKEHSEELARLKTNQSSEYISRLMQKYDAILCAGFQMHAAEKFKGKTTDERRKSFEMYSKRMAALAGHDAYWYCNFDEYGAYRNQVRLTEMEVSRVGAKLDVTLRRPCLIDLNDPIPLTFEIGGADLAAVLAIRAEGTRVLRCDDGDVPRFHLPHDRSERLPVKVGAIYNDGNRNQPGETDVDSDFPELQGLLWYENGTLRWTLKNTEKARKMIHPLSSVRITYRLPTAFKDGVQVNRVDGLTKDRMLTGSLKLERRTDEYKHLCGKAFFVVQIDAIRKKFSYPISYNEPIRIYLTARVDLGLKRDETYPKGGFEVLGPIPGVQFSQEMVNSIIEKGANTIKLADGSVLGFSDKEPNPAITVKGCWDGGLAWCYNPEYILTRGTWRFWIKGVGTREDVHFLRSNILSDSNQEAILEFDVLSLQSIFLNGEEVSLSAQRPKDQIGDGMFPKNKGCAIKLRKGSNLLVIVGKRGEPTNMSFQSLPGVLLRIVSPDTGTRLTNIAYRFPK